MQIIHSAQAFSWCGGRGGGGGGGGVAGGIALQDRLAFSPLHIF